MPDAYFHLKGYNLFKYDLFVVEFFLYAKNTLSPQKFSCFQLDISTLAPLFEWATKNFIVQNVRAPTCPASSTVRDLIFTSFSTNIINVTVFNCFDTYDHAIVTFAIDVPVLCYLIMRQLISVGFYIKLSGLFFVLVFTSYWSYSSDRDVDSM